MNSVSLARLKEVFHAVRELPSAARDGFLARECGSDQQLREKVEALLKSDGVSETFLADPSAQLVADAFNASPEPSVAGRMIDRYRIIREIGRGGMGAVYLAERADDEYQKQVALKLIKRGMDTDSVLRHFRNERQILAGFDHPNIARLLDGGTSDDGLPYFVMEFVEGLPIDEYCDNHDLAVPARLQLFREVCAAVSYAHRHLVIHRDIKRSNILVTAEGVPKLLDFGIAKILQEDGAPLATLTGQRLMTPEYASPEQARGERVTTASDVYSLGVVLYELLTGQSPYRLTTRTSAEISHAISNQQPERPSTVSRGASFQLAASRDLKSRATLSAAISTTSCSWRCAKSRSAVTNRSSNSQKTSGDIWRIDRFWRGKIRAVIARRNLCAETRPRWLLPRWFCSSWSVASSQRAGRPKKLARLKRGPNGVFTTSVSWRTVFCSTITMRSRTCPAQRKCGNAWSKMP